MKQKAKKKKRHLKKEVIWFLHGLVFVAVAVIMCRRVLAAPVTGEVVIECGESLPAPESFFLHEAEDVSYATPEEIRRYLEDEDDASPADVDTAVLGAHRVYLNHGGRIVEAMLIVEDTLPPVISGVTEQTVLVGDTVSYRRGVSVTDNHDEEIDLIVDASSVDLTTAGDYLITYHAMDRAGNRAVRSTLLHVKEPEAEPEEVLTEEERILYEAADNVLSQILTDDMTEREKARAIYEWVHDIEYIHIYETQTDAENAMQGLTKRTGDCHVYEATARLLLTRIGIETITVSNIEPAVAHAWNLILIDGSWRHFDATRRYQEADLFCLTTEELMAYSTTHNYSHLFDRAIYPAAE